MDRGWTAVRMVFSNARGAGAGLAGARSSTRSTVALIALASCLACGSGGETVDHGPQARDVRYPEASHSEDLPVDLPLDSPPEAAFEAVPEVADVADPEPGPGPEPTMEPVPEPAPDEGPEPGPDPLAEAMPESTTDAPADLAPDPGPPDDRPCTYHTDCYPKRWCGRWYALGINRCSTPCAGAADCAPDETCTPVPGSANQGYCQPTPNPGGAGNGESCGIGFDCKGAVCLDGACTTSCGASAACGAGTSCQAVGSLTKGMHGACAPGAGLLPLGATCLSQGGAVFDGAACVSGHCDLLAATPPCSAICSTDAQCGPGQVCNIVIRGTAANADALPYDPQYTAPTHDAILGCYSRPVGGMQAAGTVCTGPNDCKSSKCFALYPGDPTMRCTTWCVTDSDCPATMKCATEAVTLVSYWLQQPFAQGVDPTGRTLIRVCK